MKNIHMLFGLSLVPFLIILPSSSFAQVSSSGSENSTTDNGPMLRLVPNFGPPGTEFTVYGSGFPPDQDVTLSGNDIEPPVYSWDNYVNTRSGYFQTSLTVSPNAPPLTSIVVVAQTEKAVAYPNSLQGYRLIPFEEANATFLVTPKFNSNEVPTTPIGPIQNKTSGHLTIAVSVINQYGGKKTPQDFKISVFISPENFPNQIPNAKNQMIFEMPNLRDFTVSPSIDSDYTVSTTGFCKGFSNFDTDYSCTVTYHDKPSSTSAEHSSIPGWIKKSALWWSQGQTSDQEYASSIGWLVANGVINLQSGGTASSTILVPSNIHIPSWIKNDASWWAAGSIDDVTYVQSIQYMLNSNIITFANSNSQTQTGSTTYDVSLKIADGTTGQPVDSLVTITANSNPITVETDRNGIAHFTLSAGDYEVQVDSQNYRRMNENLAVTNNIQQTLQVQSIQAVTPSQSPTIEPSTPSNSSPPSSIPSQSTTSNQTPIVSGSPPTASFTYSSSSSCPIHIATATLISDQEGTWSVANAPDWINVVMNNNYASISFNCHIPQNMPAPFGTITFQFTNSNGITGFWVMTISGKTN